MLYNDKSAEEADITEAETSEPKASRRRLSDEDQLYVWCLLLQNSLVGQTNVPSYRERRNCKPHYERLLPDSLIIQELTRMSDVEITVDMLKAICKRFQGTRPPYDSFKLPPTRGLKNL